MLGDFNDRCVDWEGDHPESELGVSLRNILKNYDISQIINVRTRDKYLLDLLFTNRPDVVHSLDVLKSFDNLDHDTIMGHLKISYTSKKI